MLQAHNCHRYWWNFLEWNRLFSKIFTCNRTPVTTSIRARYTIPNPFRVPKPPDPTISTKVQTYTRFRRYLPYLIKTSHPFVLTVLVLQPWIFLFKKYRTCAKRALKMVKKNIDRKADNILVNGTANYCKLWACAKTFGRVSDCYFRHLQGSPGSEKISTDIYLFQMSSPWSIISALLIITTLCSAAPTLCSRKSSDKTDCVISWPYFWPYYWPYYTWPHKKKPPKEMEPPKSEETEAAYLAYPYYYYPYAYAYPMYVYGWIKLSGCNKTIYLDIPDYL